MSDVDPVTIDGRGISAGRAYGEALRPLVQDHHAMVVEHLRHRLPRLEPARLAEAVRAHRAATVEALPEIAAEVDGIGDGAGIGTDAAWVLQLRAELERAAGGGPVVPEPPECSTLAVLPDRSATGHVIAAQNVDLPPRYAPLMVLVRRRLDEDITFVTPTPAGQLAHHGLNSHGVAVFATFIHTDGWRSTVPRYLLTRVALAERSVADAARAVTEVPRAAPRTLLLADPSTAACLELTPTEVGRAPVSEGYLAHTNHIIGALEHQDTAGADWLRNSRARLVRLHQHLEVIVAGGPVEADALHTVLRDRTGAPDALCHRADDDPAIDYATVCSSIADTAARVLWVALGDPSAPTPYRPVPVSPSAKEEAADVPA